MKLRVIGLSLSLLVAPAGAIDCTGDCDCSGAVTVDEITKLATGGLTGGLTCSCGACPSGGVAVDCIVQAIGNALGGCPRLACLGDCDGDGRVTQAEFDACIPGLALAVDSPPACCDGNSDRVVSTDELILIRSNQISGCLHLHQTSYMGGTREIPPNVLRESSIPLG